MLSFNVQGLFDYGDYYFSGNMCHIRSKLLKCLNRNTTDDDFMRMIIIPIEYIKIFFLVRRKERSNTQIYDSCDIDHFNMLRTSSFW